MTAERRIGSELGIMRAGSRARVALLTTAMAALMVALALTGATAAHASTLEGEAGFCRATEHGGYADSNCTLPASGAEARFEWVPAAGVPDGGSENTKNSTIDSDLGSSGEVICKSTSGRLEFEGTTGLTDALKFSRCLEEEAGCGAGASPLHGGVIEAAFSGSLEANAAHEVLFHIPTFTLEFECQPSNGGFFINADPATIRLGATNAPIPATAFDRIRLTAHAHETEGASFAKFEPQLEFRTPFEFRTHVPAVTGVSPRGGAPGGGTSVTLTGLNFSEVESVSFGATPALGYTVESPTQITATAPPGNGQVNVIVTNAAGSSAAGNANEYSYAPIVESVSPMAGPDAGGTTVTITGKKLDEATGVKFQDKAAASWEVVSPETIRAVSPPGGGLTDVHVEAPSGVSARTQADEFLFLPVPTVSKLSTKKGPVTGGTNVVIKGENLYRIEQVMFGSVPATSVKGEGQTIEVLAPPNAAQTVNVTVKTPGGTSPGAGEGRVQVRQARNHPHLPCLRAPRRRNGGEGRRRRLRGRRRHVVCVQEGTRHVGVVRIDDGVHRDLARGAQARRGQHPRRRRQIQERQGAGQHVHLRIERCRRRPGRRRHLTFGLGRERPA